MGSSHQLRNLSLKQQRWVHSSYSRKGGATTLPRGCFSSSLASVSLQPPTRLLIAAKRQRADDHRDNTAPCSFACAHAAPARRRTERTVLFDRRWLAPILMRDRQRRKREAEPCGDST